MGTVAMWLGRDKDRLLSLVTLITVCYIAYTYVFQDQPLSHIARIDAERPNNSPKEGLSYRTDADSGNGGVELLSTTKHALTADAKLASERLSEESRSQSGGKDSQIKAVAHADEEGEPGMNRNLGNDAELNTQQSAMVVDHTKDPAYIKALFEPTVIAHGEQLDKDCATEVDWGLVEDSRKRLRELCVPRKGDTYLEDKDIMGSMEKSHIRCTSPGQGHALKPLRMCEMRNVAVDWTKMARPIRAKPEEPTKVNTDIRDQHLPLDWKTSPAFTMKPGVLSADCELDTDHGNQTLGLLVGLDKNQGGKAAQLIRATSLKGKNFVKANTYELSMGDVCTEINTVPHTLMTVARRDDHCPFFAFSVLLNAFWTTQVFNLDAREVQIMFLDRGHNSDLELPLNDMWQAFFPNHDILFDGRHVEDKERPGISCYKHLISLPSEYEGPIMNHLSNGQKCKDSNLVKDFRTAMLKTMQIKDPRETTERKKLSFIVRRDVVGDESTGKSERKVFRKFANEVAVIAALEQHAQKHAYDLSVVDLADIPLAEQARMFHDADVVIAFHGAGLVQTLFMGAGQTLIEIMEQPRHRYSFQAICGYVGAGYRILRTSGAIDVQEYTVDPDMLLEEIDKVMYPVPKKYRLL
ncbi:hypothetical protein SARC_09222 [Sphaeroforma arctica JP610]|uniref:Glycosyltransferase 61 catalytic domain-containing protein n=1 Tax=Sphaeroforma arctica JP610 TaxID=667725 RepID=A0A0L0FQQ0_9EUKA|nr:hypothetical protein SARC_09222 [Sphaeroforma arctica JP610]KNC78338.1 hypothetical protein SARC_09222 [Sphaeroforma arctica JP610]|eukprot:XP_014152240.1 hypothetical protein SARC_09222 [Sphaeroforma arctica JP610]